MKTNQRFLALVKKIPLTLLLAGAIVSSQARADESCKDFRLDTEGGPMALMPVKDQRDLGICFAETAAQMIDAWRFSHGDRNYGARTSGIDAAIRISEAQGRNSVEIGNTCAAIRMINESDACNETSMMDTTADKKESRKKYINGLEGLYQEHRQFLVKFVQFKAEYEKTHPYSPMGELIEPKHVAHLKTDSQKVLAYLRNSGQPANPRLTESYIGQLLEQDSPMIFIEGVMATQCVRSSKHSAELTAHLPHCNKFGGRNQGYPKFEQFIDRAWSEPNPQPIAISYCPKVLSKGRGFLGVERDLKIKHTCETKSGVGHASLIIGRRRDPKTGACQYRLRNSYGESCVGKNGKPKYSQNWECDAGNIWIDEDELMKNTVGVAYLRAP